MKKPTKGTNNDVWDWEVLRGDIELHKETLVDQENQITSAFRPTSSKEAREKANFVLSDIRTLIQQADDLIGRCESMIENTIDFDEALNHIKGLVDAGKVAVPSNLRMVYKIEGVLERTYILKCVNTVYNSAVLTPSIPATDARMPADMRQCFEDLHDDNLLFASSMRRDITDWVLEGCKG